MGIWLRGCGGDAVVEVDVLVVGHERDLGPLGSVAVPCPFSAINWLWEGNAAKAVLYDARREYLDPLRHLYTWLRRRRPEIMLLAIAKTHTNYTDGKTSMGGGPAEHRIHPSLPLYEEIRRLLDPPPACLTRIEGYLWRVMADGGIALCGQPNTAHIHNMRKKGIRIENIRGKGYRLVR